MVTDIHKHIFAKQSMRSVYVFHVDHVLQTNPNRVPHERSDAVLQDINLLHSSTMSFNSVPGNNHRGKTTALFLITLLILPKSMRMELWDGFQSEQCNSNRILWFGEGFGLPLYNEACDFYIFEPLQLFLGG